MDGSADATSDSSISTLSESEAADALDSANDSDVGNLGSDGGDRADVAPAEKSKPKAPAAKPADAKPAENKALNDAFEKIAGFRLHKEDVAKFKELIKGAYGSFSETARIKALLKPENRDKLFDELGIDVDSLAAERLSKKLQERLETPEEKQAREEREELEKLRADAKKREEQDAEKAQTELADREKARINTTWTDALRKSGLPPRRENLVRMAQVARDYLLKKNVEPPVEHLIEIVREEREFHERERMRSDIEESEDAEFDGFMKKLSDKARKRMRDWFIAQVRRPTGAAKSTQAAPSPRASASGKAAITPDQWREQMGL